MASTKPTFLINTKLLVPTESLLSVEKTNIFLGEKESSLGRMDFKQDEPGGDLVAVIDRPAGSGEFRSGPIFNPCFEIVFGRGQPFEGQLIVPTLSGSADLAKDFIQACEECFVLKKEPGAPTAAYYGLI